MFDKEINNLHKTIPDSDFEKSRIEILNKYNLNKTRTEKKNIFNVRFASMLIASLVLLITMSMFIIFDKTPFGEYFGGYYRKDENISIIESLKEKEIVDELDIVYTDTNVSVDNLYLYGLLSDSQKNVVEKVENNTSLNKGYLAIRNEEAFIKDDFTYQYYFGEKQNEDIVILVDNNSKNDFIIYYSFSSELLYDHKEVITVYESYNNDKDEDLIKLNCKVIDDKVLHSFSVSDKSDAINYVLDKNEVEEIYTSSGKVEREILITDELGSNNTVLALGLELELEGYIYPKSQSEGELEWSINNKSAATLEVIDNNRVRIIPKKVGFVKVYAKSPVYGDIKGVYDIKIIQHKAEQIDLYNVTSDTALKINTDSNNIETISIEENESIKIKYDVLPFYTYNKNINVIIDREDIACYTIDEEKSIVTIDGKDVGGTNVIFQAKSNKNITSMVRVRVTGKTYPIESLEVIGDSTCLVGYDINLNVKTKPVNTNQDVIWELHDDSKDLAKINEYGNLKALKSGNIKVRAISKENSNIKSEFFTIVAKDIPEAPEIIDMKGYEIVIMVNNSYTASYDPFHINYKQDDKEIKQSIINENQEKYNCKIVYESFPFFWASYYKYYWLSDNRIKEDVQSDLIITTNNSMIISNKLLYDYLIEQDCIYELTELYDKYGMNNMTDVEIEQTKHRGKLWSIYYSDNRYNMSQTLGLYYNYGWVKELGMESPAKLFNEGKWTYSNFIDWVLTAQSLMGEEEYVLGGYPYYYFYGLSNAANEVIIDKNTLEVNLFSKKTKDAVNMINYLVSKGAVNINITFSETDDIESSFWKNEGGTLMTTGFQYYVKNKGRWNDKMWGEDTTEFGYVPFPYPDYMNKDQTRISISQAEEYMFLKGRKYPDEIGENAFENVFYIINNIQHDIIKNVETYIDKNGIYFNDTTLLDDEESNKALMYYYNKKIVDVFSLSKYFYQFRTDIGMQISRVMYEGYNYEDELQSKIFALQKRLETYPNLG